VIGDDHAEDGVAEELEALVRVVAGVLGAPRPVDERGSQDVRAVDSDAETLGQLIESVDGKGDGAASEPGEDVIDGVAHRLDVLEVFVLDAEAHAALGQLLLEGLGELDEREGVGVEVVGERVAFVDGRRLDFEDVGKAVADQVEDLLTIHRATLDMGLGGHSDTPGHGQERRAV
jgi:hypothetical protein